MHGTDTPSSSSHTDTATIDGARPDGIEVVPDPPAATPPSPTARRIPYQPALDGLRAFVLLGMMLFHHGFSWISGGFLTVSTFFTLSGFLITALLVSEYESTGGIALVKFWGRRFRRLLPGAAFAMLMVVVVGSLIWTTSQMENLRGDVLAAVAYVANWRFIVVGTSYGEIFQAPSPLQHFWTLAIEEQFYLFYPLVMGGAVLVAKGRRSIIGAILICLMGWSFVVGQLLYHADVSGDRIYYGTDTRVFELLAGCVLGLFTLGHTTVRDPRKRAFVNGLGVVALVYAVALWMLLDLETRALYFGGFNLYSLLSVLMIAACVQPDGPLRWFLSNKVLVWIGVVSYGAYLYHWPVFVWLSPDRTGLDPWPLLALRLTVTFILAALSYYLVELPLRSGKWSKGKAPWVILPAMVGAVVVATFLVTSGDAGPSVDLDQALETVEEAGSTDPATDSPNKFVPTAPDTILYGDSTLTSLGQALVPFADESADVDIVGNQSKLGCGLTRGGLRFWQGEELEVEDDCWSTDWSANISERDPDIALVMAAPWDLADRKLAGDDTWRAPGDPVYDAYLKSEMLAATDVLSAGGARVVWVTTPPVEPGMIDGVPPADRDPASDPARAQRFNELLGEVAAERPGTVQIIDLASYIASLDPGQVDTVIRPDGIHYSEEGAQLVVDEFFADELLGIASSITVTE